MWLGSNPPWEVIELHLCRDVYRCLPSELAEEPYDNIATHLMIMQVEAETRNK